jgi:CubicO group peptidase (beta-lactamase class C family)
MTWSWCGCLLAACAVRIAVAVVTTSHSVSAADFSAADALILRLMSMDNVPGAALALIKDGNIVLEKGYGFRDLETHDPVTTTTLFNIGSISKSFTALGIAQLFDCGGSASALPLSLPLRIERARRTGGSCVARVV